LFNSSNDFGQELPWSSIGRGRGRGRGIPRTAVSGYNDSSDYGLPLSPPPLAPGLHYRGSILEDEMGGQGILVPNPLARRSKALSQQLTTTAPPVASEEEDCEITLMVVGDEEEKEGFVPQALQAAPYQGYRAHPLQRAYSAAPPALSKAPLSHNKTDFNFVPPFRPVPAPQKPRPTISSTGFHQLMSMDFGGNPKLLRYQEYPIPGEEEAYEIPRNPVPDYSRSAPVLKESPFERFDQSRKFGIVPPWQQQQRGHEEEDYERPFKGGGGFGYDEDLGESHSSIHHRHSRPSSIAEEENVGRVYRNPIGPVGEPLSYSGEGNQNRRRFNI